MFFASSFQFSNLTLFISVSSLLLIYNSNKSIFLSFHVIAATKKNNQAIIIKMSALLYRNTPQRCIIRQVGWSLIIHWPIHPCSNKFFVWIDCVKNNKLAEWLSPIAAANLKKAFYSAPLHFCLITVLRLSKQQLIAEAFWQKALFFFLSNRQKDRAPSVRSQLPGGHMRKSVDHVTCSSPHLGL